MTIRNVEAFAEKFSVAQDFNLAFAKIFNNGVTVMSGSFAVAMSGVDTCVAESLSDVERMADVDAVADSGAPVSLSGIIFDDSGIDFLGIHNAGEVGINEFAEFGTDIF